jgi:L-asparaginase II
MDGQVLLAQVTRNGWVESVHTGHAVIVDPDGVVVRSWGRPEDPVLPRSSNKPLQAAGMVGAGLDLAGAQLAIAAASHSGEAFHLETVRSILADAGLTEADLANTPALPYAPAAQIAWIRAGGGPTSLTQNCSGKHAAMLRTALALGAPLTDYVDPEHPVQRAAAAGIERLSGERIVATGVDGCGAPVAAISLVGLARAFSRMVLAGTETAEGRVARAMAAHPAHVGGTGRDVTLFMAALPGAIAKDGAESVHAFALPDGHSGALKVADGSERARAAVAVALLRHLGVDPRVLAAAGPAPILGGGRPVGAVEAVI